MRESEHPQLEVHAVPVDQRAAALALVFDWEPEVQRDHRVSACLELADANDDVFEFLLEIRRSGARVGAAWGQPTPGRMINVWPPTLIPGETIRAADLLQAELDRRLHASGFHCVQAILPLQAHAPAACLLRHGYSLAAQLLFLASTVQQMPEESTPTELTFQPYREDQRLRLLQLIDETYIHTNDVPALNGWRSTSDVLEGYQLTGNYSPDLWFFVQHGNRDVGCLLLTDHPLAGRYELIYMGLIPSARGNGWGKCLAQHAQKLTLQAGREAILLGVDAANHPALMTYARCGFEEVDRRLVFCKSTQLPT